MANIFIFSSAEPTLRSCCGDTGQEGHELDGVWPYIWERDQVELLQDACPEGRCYLWGAQDRGDNLQLWREMTAEDLLLCYRRRTIVSAAHVLMKINSPALAARIWENDGTAPFGLLCFLDKPLFGATPITAPLSRYLDDDCPGFKKLDQGKCRNMQNDYGTFENFVRLGLGFDFPFSLRHTE